MMALWDMMPYSERMAGDDCFTIGVCNILRYKQFPHYQRIYKQCGLVFFERQNSLLPTLSSRFMSIAEELHLLHQLRITRYEGADVSAFIKQVKQWLGASEPVLIAVDSYHLPYFLSYRKKHDHHYVTAIGYSEDTLTVLDDFYNVKTELPFSLVAEASESFEIGLRRHSYILSTDEAVQQVSREQLEKVLWVNGDVNRGQVDLDKIRRLEGLPDSAEVTVGLPAITAFANKLELLFQRDILSNQHLKSLYEMLSRMSNSRFRFAYFLANGSDEDIRELSEVYDQLGQDWKVVANMIFKASMKANADRENLLERAVKKLGGLVSQEQKTFASCERQSIGGIQNVENRNAALNVKGVVTTYLGELLAEKQQALTDDLNILEAGLIDSLGVMNLINFLETRFEFEIQDSEFEMDNFQSINSITALVHKYIN